MRKFTNFFIATLVAVALSVSCSSDADVDVDVDVDDTPVVTTTYTVTFESNGGDTVAAQTVKENDCATAPTPSKTGYDFVAWYSDVDLLTQYDFDTPVTKDITLYAGWELKSYTVAFYIDYIDNTSTPYGSEVCQPGETVSEPVVDAKFGYTFDGWYAEGLYKWNFDVDVVPAEGVTLYATWIADTYNVIFYNNDDENSTYSTTVQFGWTVVAPTDPTRSDFIFAGWYSDVTCETEYEFEVIDESNYPTTGTIKLYARWISTKSVATIYFYSALDYTGDEEPIYTESLRAELAASNIDANPDLGYSTDGEWYTDKACTEVYDFTTTYSEEAEMIEVNLYAKWEVSKYTITFDANGKETTVPDPITEIVHGTIIDASLIVDCPAPGDYIFDGWYTDSRCATAFDVTEPITSDLTLYASWTKGDITVYFVYQDGVTEDGETVLPFVDDIYGYGTATEPTTNPTRDGYTFVGWYNSSTLSAKYDFTEGLTGDTYVYAGWWDNATTDYEIHNVTQLCLFRDLVNAGIAGTVNATLWDDIDLSSVCSATLGVNWEGIGLNPTGNTALENAAAGLYEGTFDGNGYFISNIYFHSDYVGVGNSSSTGLQGGLFSQVGNGAVIKNVTIKDIYVYASSGPGAIVGIVARGAATIENCITEGGYIYGSNQSGGILGNSGYLSTSGSYVIIKDCQNLGTQIVAGSNYTGGIVGRLGSYSADLPSQVINCYNEGAVNGPNYSGGIAGGVGNAAQIIGCHNAGAITKTNRVGGIVGSAGEYIANTSSTCLIIGCYNTGTVTGTGAYVGGLMGYAAYGCTIIGSYNSGVVTSTNASPLAGGIISAYGASYPPTLTANYFITGTATNGNATDANDEGAEPVADIAELSTVLSTMNAAFSTYGYEFVYDDTVDEYPVIQEIVIEEDDEDDDDTTTPVDE